VSITTVTCEICLAEVLVHNLADHQRRCTRIAGMLAGNRETISR
jgi:hypothetical protein